MNLIWRVSLPEKALEKPAAEFLNHYGIVQAENGWPIQVVQKEGSICSAKGDRTGAILTFGKRVELFRGLLLLKEAVETNPEKIEFSQTCAVDWLGPMVDCSRNAVMKPEKVKELILMQAAMGMNGLMLYTEDTYELPGEPYFGHFRGRYTLTELKELDAYAASFGIEMIPCIQGLAHLNGIFRWPAYQNVRDINDILLVGEEKTYELLDKMIGTLSNCFASRSINLGMDEAMMLGLGKYLYKEGYHKRFEILSRHLDRVRQICAKYGLKPMIWSDMYLRTDAEGRVRDYYDVTTPLPADIAEKIPKEVQLVFWDYYHTNEEAYRNCLRVHKEILKKPDTAFAGGAWKWGNFCPAQSFSVATSEPALAACLKENVRMLTITCWGDDGAESAFFGLLPIFQLYAERCYDIACKDERLHQRFTACTGGVWQDFMDLELPNCTPENPERENSLNTPCKYELYQDLLCPLADCHVGAGSGEHYAKTASLLHAAANRNGRFAYLFETEAALCEVLAEKAELGLRLKAAYDASDRAALKEIAEVVIPSIEKKLGVFTTLLEKQWNTENKPFGFDILDMRLGGVANRMATARRRILAYLSGEVNEIPELQEERLFLDCRKDANERPLAAWNLWSEVNSVNVLFHPKI